MSTQHCQHFMPTQHRFCRMPLFPNSQYCRRHHTTYVTNTRINNLPPTQQHNTILPPPTLIQPTIPINPAIQRFAHFTCQCHHTHTIEQILDKLIVCNNCSEESCGFCYSTNPNSNLPSICQHCNESFTYGFDNLPPSPTQSTTSSQLGSPYTPHTIPRHIQLFELQMQLGIPISPLKYHPAIALC